MFKDSFFVITFQLTLIGVVLIGGLFLIWKAISRMEENIEILMMHHDAKAYSTPPSCPMDGVHPMQMMSVDSMMQKLFQESELDDKHHEYTVIDENNTQPVFIDSGDSVIVHEEAPSEVSESPLSRTKLRQMSVDKIKAICEEKGISTDGTKNQLIDKILQV